MRLPETLTAVLLAPALLLASPAGAEEAPDGASDSCAEAAVPGEGGQSGDLRYDLQTGGEANFYVWFFLLFPDAASGGSSSATLFVVPSNCASEVVSLSKDLVVVGLPAGADDLEATVAQAQALAAALAAGGLPPKTADVGPARLA